MLTSRRDYILRIIDEVSRLLARVIFKHRSGEQEAALQTIVQACERLFSMPADQLFQFTPEQHFVMLTEGETPEIGRNKLLLYAALNAEAGHVYTTIGNAMMARASFLNALRFALRARTEFPPGNLPPYAPSLAELKENLAGAPLDPATQELLKSAESKPIEGGAA
jgi:hypothetical protein